jgi:hypothetical protein
MQFSDYQWQRGLVLFGPWSSWKFTGGQAASGNGMVVIWGIADSSSLGVFVVFGVLVAASRIAHSRHGVNFLPANSVIFLVPPKKTGPNRRSEA